MRVLLDECMPRKFKLLLSGHECRTTPEAGFAGKKNGELPHLAEKDGYEVLLTLDRGIEHQVNLTGLKISVLILRVKSSRLKDLAPLAEECLKVLPTLSPGLIRKL